ncbi:MAG: Cyanate lyase, CynS [Frondihabitans sp.]|nr:Cyanate lyase, CynS [Frondihabitans sp.]
MDKKQAAARVVEAKERLDLSWKDIAAGLGTSPAWTVAALLGNHPVPDDVAARAVALLELDTETGAALRRQPYRVTDPTLLSDPTIYRFHEALNVYGPAIKELIHEEFGDGIMSAINFNLSVERRPHDGGDRVRVVFDGKFLKYEW